jgi:hypothetical protein
MRGLNRESVRGKHQCLDFCRNLYTQLQPIEPREKVNIESPLLKRKVLPISLGNFILSS